MKTEKPEALFTFGEAGNVRLTPIELDRLKKRFGERGANEWIDRLSLWKAAKGKRTKSDYYTILMWARKDADRTEALEDDPMEQTALAEMRAKDRVRTQEVWDRQALEHQHGPKCQFGRVCAWVAEKRPQ